MQSQGKQTFKIIRFITTIFGFCLLLLILLSHRRDYGAIKVVGPNECDWSTSFRKSDYFNDTLAQYIEALDVHNSIHSVNEVTLFNYTINQPQVCQDSRTFTVIYVHSKPTRFKQRQFIRFTWGHPRFREPFGIKLVFIMGEQSSSHVKELIDHENELYRDIIQADFEDTYRNLVFKEAAGLSWCTTYCPNARFIIKADDDLVIQPWRLLPLLTGYLIAPGQLELPEPRHGQLNATHKHTRTMPRRSNLQPRHVVICQLIDSGAPVIRDPASKWYVPLSVYRRTGYPEYCNGPLRIYTHRTAARLLSRSSSLLQQRTNVTVEMVLPIEDAYFTGVVANRVGVTRVGVTRFLAEPRLFAKGLWLQYGYVAAHAKLMYEQRRLWRLAVKDFFQGQECVLTTNVLSIRAA